MKTIVVMALLSISLVAVIALIGISSVNSSVPTIEATHQTAVVILGCGPAEDNPTFLVEVYNGSTQALGRVVSIGDPCTRALADLTNQGYSVVGMAGRTSTNGDGFFHTLIFEDIPHIFRRDE